MKIAIIADEVPSNALDSRVSQRGDEWFKRGVNVISVEARVDCRIATAKNDQVGEMELYLATMIRQVDSSLLDEWEKMRDPNYQVAASKEVRPPGAEEAANDITRDVKAFTAAIRNNRTAPCERKYSAAQNRCRLGS